MNGIMYALAGSGRAILLGAAGGLIALAVLSVTVDGPAHCEIAPAVGQIVTDRLTGRKLMVRNVVSCTVIARDETGRIRGFDPRELDF